MKLAISAFLCVSFLFSIFLTVESQHGLHGGVHDGGIVDEEELQHIIETLKPKVSQRYPAYSFDQILKVQTQIVAGKKYYVLFRLKHTSSALTKTEKPRKICRAEIVRMVWLDVTDVLKLRCSKR